MSKKKQTLSQKVSEAINDLISPDECDLEEALNRLEEVKSDIETQINAIEEDLAAREE